MLPVVVSIAVGGFAQSLQSQGLGGVIGQLTGAVTQGGLGGQAAGGIFGALTNFLGSLFGAPKTGAPSPSPQGALDKLTEMFRSGNLPAEISQSGLEDQIGKILSGKP
jgi:hypothetical protein